MGSFYDINVPTSHPKFLSFEGGVLSEPSWVLRASETLRGRDKLSGLYRVLFMSGLNPQTHKSKTLLCGLVIVDPFHIQSPKGFRGD